VSTTAIDYRDDDGPVDHGIHLERTDVGAAYVETVPAGDAADDLVRRLDAEIMQMKPFEDLKNSFKQVKHRLQGMKKDEQLAMFLRIMGNDLNLSRQLATEVKQFILGAGSVAKLKKAKLLKNREVVVHLLRDLGLHDHAEVENSVYVHVLDGQVIYLGKAINDDKRNESAQKFQVRYVRLDLDVTAANSVTLEEFEAVVRVWVSAAMIDPCRHARAAFIEATVGKRLVARRHPELTAEAYEWGSKRFEAKAVRIRRDNGFGGGLTARQVAELFAGGPVRSFVNNVEVEPVESWAAEGVA